MLSSSTTCVDPAHVHQRGDASSEGGDGQARRARAVLGLWGDLRERRQAGRLRLLLDYDGTLAPIAPRPERAAPDHAVFALMEQLLRTPSLDVALVSGRSRDTLQAWFGHLPLPMWAEHGLWHRPADARSWRETVAGSSAWMHDVVPTIQQAASAAAGARVERKVSSVAFHYREADPTVGLRAASALRRQLVEVIADRPLEVIDGKMVIEVRRAGVSKAIAARHVAAAGVDPVLIVAFGDDHTDEELFAALPAQSLTVAVGADIAVADHRLVDVADVRRVLALLATAQLATDVVAGHG